MATNQLEIWNGALLALGADTLTSLAPSSDRAKLLIQFYAPCRKATLRAHPWNFALHRTQLDARATMSATLSTSTGTISITAASAIFEDDDVGQLVQEQATAGRGRITSVTSSTVAVMTALSNFSSTALAALAWRIKPGFEYEFRFAKPDGYLRAMRVEWEGVSGTPVWWWWTRRSPNAEEPLGVEGQFLVGSGGPQLNLQYVRDIEDTTKFDPLFEQAFIHYLAYKISYGITGAAGRGKLAYEEYKAALADARNADGQESEQGVDVYGDDLIAVRRGF